MANTGGFNNRDFKDMNAHNLVVATVVFGVNMAVRFRPLPTGYRRRTVHVFRSANDVRLLRADVWAPSVSPADALSTHRRTESCSTNARKDELCASTPHKSHARANLTTYAKTLRLENRNCSNIVRSAIISVTSSMADACCTVYIIRSSVRRQCGILHYRTSASD